MSRELLKVSGLSMRFGGLLAVNGVALTVKENWPWLKGCPWQRYA